MQKHIFAGLGILILIALFIGLVVFRKPDPTLMSEKADTVTFVTNMGSIVIELDNKQTPNTAENFAKLAREGFYTGTKFHRIIDGFMIQGGDPLTKDASQKDAWGTGGPGYTFEDELSPENSNARGTISMANRGPDTNGSQFFINLVDNGFLNSKHTVFGTVTEGMEVVDAIAKSAKDSRDRPITDITITDVIVK